MTCNVVICNYMLPGGGCSVKLEFTNSSEYRLAIFLLQCCNLQIYYEEGGGSVKLEFANTSGYRLAIFLLAMFEFATMLRGGGALCDVVIYQHFHVFGWRFFFNVLFVFTHVCIYKRIGATPHNTVGYSYSTLLLYYAFLGLPKCEDPFCVGVFELQRSRPRGDCLIGRLSTRLYGTGT